MLTTILTKKVFGLVAGLSQLTKDQADWVLVEDLLAKGILKSTMYEGEHYCLRPVRCRRDQPSLAPGGTVLIAASTPCALVILSTTPASWKT